MSYYETGHNKSLDISEFLEPHGWGEVVTHTYDPQVVTLIFHTTKPQWRLLCGASAKQ